MQLFLNNWASSLTLPATASAVQLSVPSADAALLTGLGAGDHYLLTLAQVDLNGIETAWEVVRVTGNTAGVLDVLRGQEGTTALELEAGTSISARLTQATMETLRDNGGPALSDTAPQALGAAAPGTSPAASRDDHVHDLPTPAEIGAATAAQGALAASAVQPEELPDVAVSGDYADLLGKPFIPSTPGDIAAATAAQGDLAETAVQPAALATALGDKVDKVTGKQLSTEDYTSAEKTKLAGLDEAHFKGTYTNLTALQAAHPAAAPGDYADVDAGAADPVLRYIWDNSDSEWVAQAGSADPITAAQVKTLYESNADTNAYTDDEKTKLGTVASGATANASTDSLAEGSSNLYHTAARVRAVVLTGLSLAVGTAIAATDTVLEAFGKLQKQVNDLVTSVAGKQATLVSGTNIKTVNGSSLLGSGDLAVAAAAPPVITESTTARTLALTGAGAYIRFTNASASTCTVPPQSSVAWAADTEIHIRRAAAGNLNLVEGAGVTLNAPSGGTLVMTNAMSVTLKRVGTDVWDVIGQTVAV